MSININTIEKITKEVSIKTNNENKRTFEEYYKYISI